MRTPRNMFNNDNGAAAAVGIITININNGCYAGCCVHLSDICTGCGGLFSIYKINLRVAKWTITCGAKGARHPRAAGKNLLVVDGTSQRFVYERDHAEEEQGEEDPEEEADYVRQTTHMAFSGFTLFLYFMFIVFFLVKMSLQDDWK